MSTSEGAPSLSRKARLKKFFTRKRNIAVGVVLVIIALIVFSVLSGGGGSEYTVEAAQRGAIVEMVSESGNVTATGVTPVYSTTTGIVESVFVANGSVATEDEVLFAVKSTATKQEQDAALAQYMAAKNAYETAQANQLSLQATMLGRWDSYKDLAESDTYETGEGQPKEAERNVAEFHVSEKEWLAAEAAYKNQQNVVNEKAVAMSAAWKAYQSTQDSEVTAVLGGEVQNLGVTVGDAVTAPSAATLASTQPALLLVANEVPTIITIQVNENDALKVQEGQEAIVEFDAIDGETFSAVVDRVDTIAAANQDVVQFTVYVAVLEGSDRIHRGMTADVDIVVSSKEDILTVPTSAVKPYQGGRAVRVVGDDGEIAFVPVEIGSQGDGRTEILSGIDEGTEVIVSLANDQVQRSGGFF